MTLQGYRQGHYYMLYITIVGIILYIIIINYKTQLSNENCHISILNYLVHVQCRYDKEQWYTKKTPRVQKRLSQSEAAVIWLYMRLKALITAQAKN